MLLELVLVLGISSSYFDKIISMQGFDPHPLEQTY